MSADMKAQFRHKLNRLRVEMDMSQEAFAKFLGISRQSIGFYETGKRLPDAEALATICSKCNVTADYLLGLSDVKTTDTDLAAVCEYTGLSESAVNFLRECIDFENEIDCNVLKTISSFLCSKSFINFCFCTTELIESCQEVLSAVKQFETDLNNVKSNSERKRIGRAFALSNMNLSNLPASVCEKARYRFFCATDAAESVVKEVTGYEEAVSAFNKARDDARNAWRNGIEEQGGK